jgi:Na+-translocating ferredoxin:NAD+ oxidoreductase RnfD subunit
MKMKIFGVPLPSWRDPRWPVFFSLLTYLIYGFFFLGFNRTPAQALVTSGLCVLCEIFFHRFFKKRWIFPLSALITSLSLTILLNYSHDFFILLLPIFFAIGSKYLFTFHGRHVYNPAQVSVTLSLLFAGHLITSAPAYQWYGYASVGVLIIFLGLVFVIPRVNKAPLVVSFLTGYTLQTLFRAWLMKHHLPFETLFWGSITSPAFFLFTFFMITDPATSPADQREQVKTGFLLATLDLLFHIKKSYYTFFYAGFTLQTARLMISHYQAARAYWSFPRYIQDFFILSGHWKRLVTLSLILLAGIGLHRYVVAPKVKATRVDFHLEKLDPASSGLGAKFSNTLERVDPRLHHIIKWILSVGDSVATGDVNDDGLPDIFLTNILKRDEDRSALFINKGNFTFERFPLKALGDRPWKIEDYGLNSNALFVDEDNDGDLDLFLVYAFGHPVLLKSLLRETGKLDFVDVTLEKGLNLYTNGISANFFDADNDGKLDLLIGNTWPRNLPDYHDQRLNIFKLPPPEYKDDIRMFNFMHSSWHLSDNGGVNDLWKNRGSAYEFVPPEENGMPETFWTLAIGTADFNHDKLIDLYIANDFGPDNFYLNLGNFKFKKIEGKTFGDLGKDTYKGMNASVEDVDKNGFPDVYVSNVHHELQAEGSLFWFFNMKDGILTFEDKATKLGALNEDRFGWGASIGDLNNDSHLDIVQANGMVDDTPDKKDDACGDYWYINEKIARSPPETHRYIHNWGDIRGYCIYPNELNRLYLNTGKRDVQMFVDVALEAGLNQEANSRGVALADFDNDGDLDVVITNQHTDVDLLRNDQKNKNDWIGLKLVSEDPRCNRMALGSVVELRWENKKGPQEVRKETKLANGFSAQNEERVHFGLGKEAQSIEVSVDWCKLEKKTLKLEKNKYHVLRSGKFSF